MSTERQPRPLKIINAVAPIRICDNGGWTDTWFAQHGAIFNIGVYPYAEVQIEVGPVTVPFTSGDEMMFRPEKSATARNTVRTSAFCMLMLMVRA